MVPLNINLIQHHPNHTHSGAVEHSCRLSDELAFRVAVVHNQTRRLPCGSNISFFAFALYAVGAVSLVSLLMKFVSGNNDE